MPPARFAAVARRMGERVPRRGDGRIRPSGGTARPSRATTGSRYGVARLSSAFPRGPPRRVVSRVDQAERVPVGGGASTMSARGKTPQRRAAPARRRYFAIGNEWSAGSGRTKWIKCRRPSPRCSIQVACASRHPARKHEHRERHNRSLRRRHAQPRSRSVDRGRRTRRRRRIAAGHRGISRSARADPAR